MNRSNRGAIQGTTEELKIQLAKRYVAVEPEPEPVSAKSDAAAPGHGFDGDNSAYGGLGETY
jgi:hypothetical protein